MPEDTKPAGTAPAKTPKPKALRTATGPVKAGYVRVRVLRNHDGVSDFYVAGEIVDVWEAYAKSQMTYKDKDGNTIHVEPAVFELVKD
ncbi:hypothetical protein FJY70_01125 [candidate division WOR-3 bacterium]|nr:hypothetical protein [candidate division WOR-3 bacterium]MBM3314263.1 hypothetical protein [candidate division WOR-3 bacterium]